MMVDSGIIASLIVLIFLCFAIPVGGFIYLSAVSYTHLVFRRRFKLAGHYAPYQYVCR